MHLGFGIAYFTSRRGSGDVVVFDGHAVEAVEHFPGADGFVLRLDRVKLADFIAAGFTGEGVGTLDVEAVAFDVFEGGAVSLGLAGDVLTLDRRRPHGESGFQAEGGVSVVRTGRRVVGAAQDRTVAVRAGVVATQGFNATHAQAGAVTCVERGVRNVTRGHVQTEVQHVAGFVHRCEYKATVDLLDAVAVGVVGVLAEHASRGIERIGEGAGSLDAQAVLMAVGPVDQVVGGVTLRCSHPLGAGGFFQAEIGVKTTDLDRDRLEAVIGQGRFVEVAVIGVATVVGHVVVDGVGPIRVQHAGQFQEGATDVSGVGRFTVVGVDTIELAVVSLQTTTELEAELFVSGSDLKAALGFDYDIGAIGSDGAGESLGGYCHCQCAGGNTCEVLADHRRIPLLVVYALENTRNWARWCWEGILAMGCVRRVAIT
ncbi:NAD-specific glutamate dehydrogenase [Pseudomonas brassicacearum]